MMDKKDIKKYLEYAKSEEALAVLFVKKYMKQAGNDVWIDIRACDAPPGYRTDLLKFKRVECELFPRRIRPNYPSRAEFKDEWWYDMACRTATWIAAHEDIDRQRRRGVKGPVYRISGVSYPKRPSKRPAPDPASFFVDDAPAEIKALAKNLNDRTDPLWDVAMQYVRGYDDSEDSDYIFKIRSIQRIR